MVLHGFNRTSTRNVRSKPCKGLRAEPAKFNDVLNYRWRDLLRAQASSGAAYVLIRARPIYLSVTAVF